MQGMVKKELRWIKTQQEDLYQKMENLFEIVDITTEVLP